MSRAEDCKQNLLIKAKSPAEGFRKVVSRGEMGLQHLDFGLLHLSDRWAGDSGDCEQALYILGGMVSVRIGKQTHEHLGRKDPFAGPPAVIYLPPGTEYNLSPEDSRAEVAVFSASAPVWEGQPAVIRPEPVMVESVGKSNWRTEVRTAIGGKFRAAKLLVGETISTGHWLSYPPHKHDAFIPPKEFPLEQISHFRVTPAQGFGLMRIYTPPNDPGRLDEVYAVQDGDTVVVSRGYHPTSAAPGCTIACVWAMAGDIRQPEAFTIDPRFAWLVA